jgi:replication factor-a protein 1 (Rpa1)
MSSSSSNITLSKGVLPRLLQEGSPNPAAAYADGGGVLLQVINYKMVDKKSPNQPLRYRVVLSDGEYRCMGMLGSNLNHWINTSDNNNDDDNDNFKYSILKITNFISNNMAGGKALLVILEAQLVERGGTSVATRGVWGGKTMQQLLETTSAACPPPPLANSTNAAASASSSSGGMGGMGGMSSSGAAAAAAAAAARSKYGSGSSSPPGNNSHNPYGNSSSSSFSPSRNPYGKSSSPSSNPYGKSSFGGSSGGAAPIVRNSNINSHQQQQYTLISNLNMYQSRWTIKARVTSKSEIRTWSNAKGEGSLFSMEMLDASGSDVRATFFKEAVDRFYSMLQVGSVYTFSGGRLKVANMQYNTCSSQYEITFDQNSEIHLVDEEQSGVPKQNYDFVKIAALEDVHVPSSTQPDGGMPQQNQQQIMQQHVDVLGIVTSVGEPTTLVSKKSGREICKCDISISDDSNAAINLTLWGEQARTAPSTMQVNQMVAFRRCRLSDFGGRSLSGPQSMTVIAPSDDASLPQAAALRTWWQKIGGNGGAGGASVKQLSGSGGASGGSQRLVPLQDRKDVAAIQHESLGVNSLHTGKADFISFKANISFIKKDKEGGAWYPACPNAGEPCKNRFKVTQMNSGGDNSWYCDKCQGTFTLPVRRWIFSAVVNDDSSSTWVSFFNEQAETLLHGKTADEIYNEAFVSVTYT